MKHSNLPILAVLFVLGGAQSYAQEKITLATLLNEMVDRKEMSYFPGPCFTQKQFSSYDRDSVDPSDQKTWFANKDYSHFVREEENEGRLEKVMFEDVGAGAVTRFWLTGATDPILRIYIDGEKEPRFEGLVRTLIGGQIYGPEFMQENGFPESYNQPLAPQPLSFRVNPESHTAYNLYLPLPYGKSCKITIEQKEKVNPKKPGRTAIFYAINYRSYKEDTEVESITPDILLKNTALINRIQSQLWGSRDNEVVNATVHQELVGTYAPGTNKTLEIEQTGSAFYKVKLRFDGKTLTSPDYLRSTVLEASFDGKRTIWAPVGSFFGTGYTLNQTRHWYGYVAPQETSLVCHWVMPFKEKATITLHNLSSEPFDLKIADLALGDYEWKEGRSMYFGSSWQQFYGVKSGYREAGAYDFNYVTLTDGKGVYVGDNLALINRGKVQWWGEGDEKIYVDGETFPSHFGTGTEDYFGYAFCRGSKFNFPFINQPDGGGNHPGHDFDTFYSINSRYRALDRIPFTKSIKVDMEQWHAGETIMDFEPTSFFYIQDDVGISVDPQLENAKRPVELK